MNLRTRITAQEQFARLLEVQSPDAAAAADGQLASMTTLANALRAAGQSPALPSPDPAFRSALRQRLVAVATVQAADEAVSPGRTTARRLDSARTRVQRRVAALAGTAMLATSVAGVGVAAAKSLPGDPFYGVKRATEDVQLTFTFGTEAKGKRHLEFARTRLAEARALPANSSHLASTLSAMDSETRAGSNDLISSYRSSQSTEPLADIVRFSRQQITDLTRLAATLPPPVRARELGSIAVVTEVVQHVHQVAKGVCLSCLLHGGGRSGVPVPAPSKSPSPHVSKHPATGKRHGHGGGAAAPSNGATPSRPAGSAKPTTSKPSPTKPPVLPIPSTLTSILNPKGHSPAPLPVVSKLLGDLGL